MLVAGSGIAPGRQVLRRKQQRNTVQTAQDQVEEPVFAAGGEKHWHVLKRSGQELISILI